jgi:hypothetical protein
MEPEAAWETDRSAPAPESGRAAEPAKRQAAAVARQANTHSRTTSAGIARSACIDSRPSSLRSGRSGSARRGRRDQRRSCRESRRRAAGLDSVPQRAASRAWARSVLRSLEREAAGSRRPAVPLLSCTPGRPQDTKREPSIERATRRAAYQCGGLSELARNPPPGRPTSTDTSVIPRKFAGNLQRSPIGA